MFLRSKDKMHLILVALGSNLGDRAATLRSAIGAINERVHCDEMSRLVVSPLYETLPENPPGLSYQPNYLNAVVSIGTRLTPEELLEVLLAIEHDHGRRREDEVPKGPRTLDLDLLGGIDRHSGEPLLVDSAILTLPHPRMHLREFVLRPLADVAPWFWHPHLGASVESLLVRLCGAAEGSSRAVWRFEACEGVAW